jgi:VWFA-related protein
MAHSWLAVCSSALFGLCSAGFGFQSPATDTSITVRPVARHEAVTTPAGTPAAHLRIDSSLVLIPVHVTTQVGTSITSLEKENFQLFEDNVEQKITTFTKDDAPLSIGLVFDTSGSMQNKMRKCTEAAATFFRTSNAEDEFFLVEFNDRPKLTVPFTADSDEIYNRIAHTKPWGRTSLLDAIHLAMVQMKQARHLRKAIVILSDGGDNRSRYSFSEIKNTMLESDVQLYAMGIFDHGDARRKPAEEKNGPRLLDQLAEQSGGRHYPVDDLDELNSISDRISKELRTQYLLGYSPTNDGRDGKYHRVRVNLLPPKEMPALRTYYRHGYYSPAQ